MALPPRPNTEPQAIRALDGPQLLQVPSSHCSASYASPVVLATTSLDDRVTIISPPTTAVDGVDAV
jgi:hypothetical protein